jgi:MutT/NUDIX family protein
VAVINGQLKLGKNSIKFKLTFPIFPKSAIIEIETQEESL